jgi:hypothetical protein
MVLVPGFLTSDPALTLYSESVVRSTQVAKEAVLERQDEMGTVGPAVLVLVFGTDAKNNFCPWKIPRPRMGKRKVPHFQPRLPAVRGLVGWLPFSSN